MTAVWIVLWLMSLGGVSFVAYIYGRTEGFMDGIEFSRPKGDRHQPNS